MVVMLPGRGSLFRWNKDFRLPFPLPRTSGADYPANPEYLVDMLEARRLLEQPDASLVSIRTWNEFIGETSGYSYIPAKGDIAGAIWGAREAMKMSTA